jgi:hypothetical protein
MAAHACQRPEARTAARCLRMMGLPLLMHGHARNDKLKHYCAVIDRCRPRRQCPAPHTGAAPHTLHPTAGWEKRWLKSTWKQKENAAGDWTWTAGRWYGDEKADHGIKTGPDSKFFAISAEMKKPFTNDRKELVLQVSLALVTSAARITGGLHRRGRPVPGRRAASVCAGRPTGGAAAVVVAPSAARGCFAAATCATAAAHAAGALSQPSVPAGDCAQRFPPRPPHRTRPAPRLPRSSLSSTSRTWTAAAATSSLSLPPGAAAYTAGHAARSAAEPTTTRSSGGFVAAWQQWLPRAASLHEAPPPRRTALLSTARTR